MNKPTSELTLRELIEQNRLETEISPAAATVDFMRQSSIQRSSIRSRVAVSWRVFPPARSC